MDVRAVLGGILGGMLLSSGATASLLQPTVLTPTDGNVNFLFNDLHGGARLALFDDADFGGTPLYLPVPSVVDITPVGGGTDYRASVAGQQLRLAGSPRFVLGVTLDNGASWLGDTGMVFLGPDAYRFEFNDVHQAVVAVDVNRASGNLQPVPLPPALWLFGAGMLGMAGVARRRHRPQGMRRLSSRLS